MEDTSGRDEPFPFTRRWTRRPWRLPHVGTGARRRSKTIHGRGSGDRGVRGSVASGAVGIKRPRSHPRQKRESRHRVSECRPAEADQSGVVKTLGPPVKSHGALDSVGRPRGESRDSEPGTREVRVHVDCSGGRSRSDASRVLAAGRSQGFVAEQGTSREEARKHRLTRSTSGQKAKRYADQRAR